MRIEQLKYLMAIDEYKSMNKASEHIFVSQPSISNAISELEQEMGVNLVIRTNKGSALTEAGEKLVEATKEFYKEYNEIKAMGQSKKMPKKQHFHIVCEYSSLSFYETVSYWYTKNHPEIEVGYILKSYLELLRFLEKNSDDIILITLNSRQLEKMRKKYSCQIVSSSKLALVVSVKSILAKNRSISISSIRNSRILMYSTEEGRSFVYYALKPYELEKQGNQFVFSTTMSLQRRLFSSPDVVMFLPDNVPLSVMDASIVRIPLKEKIEMHQCVITKNNSEIENIVKILKKMNDKSIE